ncbi:MAG: cysteine desulfurase [Clostridia bacterium]|nr:cysteine desulfurase [Clostridia bacterium]
MVNKEIYLDNAASTKPYPEVIERIREINSYLYGNSSSVHMKGLESHRIIKESRRKIAEILNCRPEEVFFTSGGSESNNMAIKGHAFAMFENKGNIVTSAFEHPTVLNTVKNLESFGFEAKICKIDSDGTISAAHVLECIDKNTTLVTIMTVNSETGTFTDLNGMAEVIKELSPTAVIHTDAVQAFGKYKMDMAAKSNIDMLSASAHKIKGPKGVGFLFVRKGTKIVPLIDGGGHQEGMRSGTENTAGIAGFALAAGIFNEKQKDYYTYLKNLKDYLIESIEKTIDGYIINSPENSSPYVLNVAFRDILAETLLNHLSGKGIYVSAGSACSSRKKNGSHVLRAMNVPEDFINGAVRISFEPDSTRESIDMFVRETAAILPILRKFRRK